MIDKQAELKLKELSKKAYLKKRYHINERIYHFVGYAHSNCILIEGNTSLILIDTLDSNKRAKKLRDEIEYLTGKVVKTIIYTHGHPDHRGGAGAFKDCVEEIIASSPRRITLKHTNKINDVLTARTNRQFGYQLNDDELINQGIGIREGLANDEGGYDFLAPTTILEEDVTERIIDGVKIHFISAVGETDDQIFVWLPDDKVLCCGDNYYAMWPNLYAIRGGQYRDIATWIESLEQILSYPSVALLPGHTNPIIGYENIQEVLGNFKEAIESILLQTLDCMNQGMSVDETLQNVGLEEKYKHLPYLQEHYGTINWSIKAIYTGYLGWFDGNPTNLNPLSNQVYYSKLIDLIGEEKIIQEIEKAFEKEEFQYALQLCDMLIDTCKNIELAKSFKIKALMALSKIILSANGRHYYIQSSKELMNK